MSYFNARALQSSLPERPLLATVLVALNCLVLLWLVYTELTTTKSSQVFSMQPALPGLLQAQSEHSAVLTLMAGNDPKMYLERKQLDNFAQLEEDLQQLKQQKGLQALLVFMDSSTPQNRLQQLIRITARLGLQMYIVADNSSSND